MAAATDGSPYVCRYPPCPRFSHCPSAAGLSLPLGVVNAPVYGLFLVVGFSVVSSWIVALPTNFVVVVLGLVCWELYPKQQRREFREES